RSAIFGSLLALAVLVAQAPNSDGARILAVYAFPAKSHFMMHRVLISELVKHGHQVTMITAHTFESLKLGSNYTEILIEPEYSFYTKVKEHLGSASLYEMKNDVALFQKLVEILGEATTDHALKLPKVQAIINAKQTEDVYDLLLVEQFYQEAFLALAHIYKVPVVSTATYAQQNFMSQMFGLITPWSYVPMGSLPLAERMSFWERFTNTYYSLRLDIGRELSYFPKMDELVTKYFGHLP
ncbi:UDP-glycosyltransferase UGT4-like, partial [Rhagoletis pomonella]|uniref:UDP-glycosyltransferase UGT4-like n=1 Tax=Rhagoletis pomonella TaxID=28610 RepID=UPI001784A02F